MNMQDQPQQQPETFHHQINVSEDLHFFYDFMFSDSVRAEHKEPMLRLIDRKIHAAREFLSYLNNLTASNERNNSVQVPPEYQNVQRELSKEIVDGKTFYKINRDFNHTTFEIEDTKLDKKKMEEESIRCVAVADESKRKFHEAVEELVKKANQLDVTTIPKIEITDDALKSHFNKVCHWILDIYYDTPASKFEWNNFKKQVFVADKGEDFKRRIRGLYIPKLYDYQIETCQYILSTRPMFMEKLNDRNWDLILSTAEDIIKAFNARLEYTHCKKVISQNTVKIVQAKLDLEQSDKVSASSRPYVKNIYEKLFEKENRLRDINLVEFNPDNSNNYMFYRGSGGKVSSFLRGEALANLEKEEEEEKNAKAGKKGGKKDGKPAEAKQAPAQQAHPQPQHQIQGPFSPADVHIGNAAQLGIQGNFSTPIIPQNVVFDTEVNMGGVD